MADRDPIDPTCPPTETGDHATYELPSYAALTQTREWAATPAPVAMPALPERPSDRYTESAVLGTGGMGKVLLAKDARIGREVAVKVLRGERELSPEERARFLREAQVQGQLEHPSIVPVYDIDVQPDGAIFFTMRRVLGKTLHAIVEDLRAGHERKHTQRELLQAFATVCLAVDYAHSRGVIHRDLKPANIMLGDFGEVYVLDWGIARVLESSGTELTEPAASRLSRPGMTIGTPLYMAPEQFEDPEIGPAGDVFALGAILFEILTLERLRFAGALRAPVDARPSVRVPELQLAPELEAICVKATRTDPAERYPTARALQEAIARYLEGDRELEQRRELAAEHAARARIALASDEQHEDLAMLELARALALDPTNVEHVGMMADVLRRPPKTMPPEVTDRIHAAEVQHVRDGARHAAIAILSWLAFIPLVLVIGIRRIDYLVLGSIPVAVTAVLAVIASRRVVVERSLQYGVVAANMVASAMVSRMFGPLILVPTLLASWAIVMQVHPERPMRGFAIVAALVGLVAPVVLEAIGVIPASYAFDRGTLEILPQMLELTEPGAIAFLTLASATAMIVPALYVNRLRAGLADAQHRELMQTWRLRRLGDNMLRVVH